MLHNLINLNILVQKGRIIFIPVFILFLIFPSCTDHRLDGMVDDQIYLLNYDMQNIDVFNFGEYTSTVVVCKGGMGNVSADVELVLDQNLIIKYNNINGTSFKMLPANCYNLSATDFHFEKGDVRKVMTITYHTGMMADLPDRNNYMIPLQMIVSEGVKFDEDKQTVMVCPNFIEPVIFFPQSSVTLDTPISAANPNTGYSFETAINYRNLIDPFAWDINFELEPDPAILAAYNTANGKNYQMLPPEAYSLNSNQWTIAIRKTIKDVPVQMFKKKLVDGFGKYAFGEYALSVRLSSVSKWFIDENRSTLLMLAPFYPSAFDPTDWKVLDWNSDITMDEQNKDSSLTPDGMLKGTGWRSKQIQPLPMLPYYFLFDMITPKTITHINIHFPTGSDAARGNLRTGYFETSLDNVTWTRIANWDRGTNNTPRIYECPILAEYQIEARYLRFVIERPINYASGNFTDGGTALMDVQRLEVIGYE